MALAAFQRALARLYTDAAAREAFAEDGRAYATACGLDAIETARLCALGPEHPVEYAAGLARKRANEEARRRNV